MMTLPNGYSYRTASNEDIPIVKSIVNQVMGEFGLLVEGSTANNDLNDIDQNFEGGFFGLIQSPDNQIIATFALFVLNETSIELRKMYLLPAFRSKGIGKWMVHFLIEKAKDLGYTKIELQTASVLQSAIAMYHKTGFDEVTDSNASSVCDRVFEMYL